MFFFFEYFDVFYINFNDFILPFRLKNNKNKSLRAAYRSWRSRHRCCCCCCRCLDADVVAVVKRRAYLSDTLIVWGHHAKWKRRQWPPERERERKRAQRSCCKHRKRMVASRSDLSALVHRLETMRTTHSQCWAKRCQLAKNFYTLDICVHDIKRAC